MSFTVKIADINDAAVLAKLGAQTFYDTFRPYNSEEDMVAYITKAYNEEVIAQNLQHKHIHYAIAFENNEPVGYIKLLHKTHHPNLTGNCIELEKIYVLQSALGSGAGNMLMAYAVMYSRQHEYDVLFLGVWEENKRAVRFYEKNGFTVFAHRSFTLGSRVCDDYMMKLDLHQRA